ncbi:MAG TPA: glycosyltransferase family 2 protein [Sulfolobales archaeon]|jgi:glycosyltransferase involved in cell wall biosynthesis|nr:glycosyltransferase family 2 protein [Sulfolobales archaeon]
MLDTIKIEKLPGYRSNLKVNFYYWPINNKVAGKTTISFITFTRNSARDLVYLLDNVSDVVDEIIIVDNYSTDDTLEVAKRYGAKVYQRKSWEYVEPNRMYALSKASHEWILYLDTDERLGSNLKNELRKLINKYGDVYDGFSVTFVNIKNGKPVLGPLYPNRHIRIFRKTKTVFRGLIHELPEVKGRVLELPENYYILHFYLRQQNAKERWRKWAKYARIEALQYYRHEGFFVRKPLWTLAPFSMPLIYLYNIVRASIKKSPINYPALYETLHLALYETLVHTLKKLRGRRRKLFAAIVQRCGFIDLIESRERGEDLITFVSRCLANKT